MMQSQHAMAVKSQTQPYSPPLSTETILSTHPNDSSVFPPPAGDSASQCPDDGLVVSDGTQNGTVSPASAASRNDTNGIEDHSNKIVGGELGSFSKKLDETEEKVNSAETDASAGAKCGAHEKEEREEKEAENDVFSGLSDHENPCDDGLSREQRSFARYESPRDVEGREEKTVEGGEEGKDGVTKERVTQLASFDSPIPAIT
ncbi:unnamed protein product [Hydatigera taeniaeformis]|uniref:Uncharacterized protein n=1 Tax=Hydatigena taeniaeformis TaxID=6205 RepID=A0A3P7ECF2_HYDTA|nr:unnamed protein product [Hydatigera taeniaeformis]